MDMNFFEGVDWGVVVLLVVLLFTSLAIISYFFGMDAVHWAVIAAVFGYGFLQGLGKSREKSGENKK